MKLFAVRELRRNNRGLTPYHGVCCHDDGYEAKVAFEDSTLHLYIAYKDQWVKPMLVAAYISHMFNTAPQINHMLFNTAGFQVSIPDRWMMDDGQFEYENGGSVLCKHGDIDFTRYRYRNPIRRTRRTKKPRQSHRYPSKQGLLWEFTHDT